jgi:hypothetical protein
VVTDPRVKCEVICDRALNQLIIQLISIHACPHTCYDRINQCHTRAKSSDHGIVKAQKEMSKGRLNTPLQSCNVITDPRVKCEVICDRSLNPMLFE